MLKDFKELREQLASGRKPVVAVACAHDAHTLEAILKASEEGILLYRLIGHAEEILRIGKELGYEVDPANVVNAETEQESAQIAVEMIRDGRADFIQKGLMQTGTLLKEVVNKETGIGTGAPMSHVALLELPGYPKLLGVTDAGMIPNPDLATKRAILSNALSVFRKLGYECPKAAMLCAAENVSSKIVETVDAAAIKEEALAGAFGSCIVEGPISFDLAMDAESAKIKGYESPVCGDVDILVTPNISAGNLMSKALILYGGAKMIGVVTGAVCPIALNSRSASFEEKYNSLLTCALISR